MEKEVPLNETTNDLYNKEVKTREGQKTGNCTN